MGQTMAEKVFSQNAERRISAGEYITVAVDRVMCHEAFSRAASKLISSGIKKIWDPEKVIVILDHYVPAPDERMAKVHAQIREMVKKFGSPSIVTK